MLLHIDFNFAFLTKRLICVGTTIRIAPARASTRYGGHSANSSFILEQRQRLRSFGSAKSPDDSEVLSDVGDRSSSFPPKERACNGQLIPLSLLLSVPLQELKKKKMRPFHKTPKTLKEGT
jgi:hypothetical protein